MSAVAKTFLKEFYRECYPWQQEALNKLAKNGGHGIVSATTGAGKTKIGLANILKNHLGAKDRLVVVVPTKVLMDQWYEEIVRLGKRYHCKWTINKISGESSHVLGIAHIDIAIVNSLRNKILPYKIMILDEIHRYASDENRGILDPSLSSYERIIGLTATLNRDDGRHKELKVIVPLVYTYTIKEAKADGTVNDYEIIDKVIYLTHDEENMYKSLDASVKERMRFFGGNFQRAVDLVKAGQYPAAGRAGALLKAVSQRKKLLLNCGNRIYEAIKIIKTHLTDKVIVFSENISSVEEIRKRLRVDGIETCIYHSKKKQRDAEIEKFNNGECNILLSAKALDEGYNIKDANIAVMVSGSSSKRQAIQRLGRIIRKSEGKSKSIMYQLYVPGTVEEKWKVKRLSK